MSTGDYLEVYGSALVGALAFAFSDTFWFNAVESEVYAASQFFVSLVVYLMMRWNEMAEEQGSERYLLLIAYLMGLSTGGAFIGDTYNFLYRYVGLFPQIYFQCEVFHLDGNYCCGYFLRNLSRYC